MPVENLRKGWSGEEVDLTSWKMRRASDCRLRRNSLSTAFISRRQEASRRRGSCLGLGLGSGSGLGVGVGLGLGVGLEAQEGLRLGFKAQEGLREEARKVLERRP